MSFIPCFLSVLSIVNNHRQPNIAEVSPHSHKRLWTVSSNDSNFNDKSTNNNCDTPLAQSRHNVHVKRIHRQYLKNMFDDKSSRMKKIHPHNSASTDNINPIAQSKTRHNDNSFTNVTVSHICRSTL